MNELLKQMIAILASALFVWLIDVFPEFPLTGETFVNFFIWLFSVLGIIHGLRYQFILFTSRVLKR